MSTYRPQFLEALKLLASAFEEVVAAGYSRPVIVGGAAVEFYTGGTVISGDFDIVTMAQSELETALLKRGFERPSGPGALLRGLHHPTLGVGTEVVSGQLFDGASDQSRILLVQAASGKVAMPPIEDLIADRMGQFNAPSQGDAEMLAQAVVLYRMAKDLVTELDEAYLDKRIKHETAGDYGLQFLIEKTNAADND